MRRRLPFDVAVCLAIALGISTLLSQAYLMLIAPAQYESHNAKSVVLAGEAGSEYVEGTTLLTSLEQLEAGESYSIFFEGYDLYQYNVNTVTAFTENSSMAIIPLESGETIPLFVNHDAILETQEGLYLPVGTLVEKNLPEEESGFWNQITVLNGGVSPTYSMGYLDMVGNTSLHTFETFTQPFKLGIQVFGMIILFVIIRRVGGKLGLFHSIFALDLKKKGNAENEKI